MPVPRVGLALGGGVVRGMAHLGVLDVLGREQIPIDCLAGTSAGAIVAGTYAAGTDLALAERLAGALEWDHLVRLGVPRLGLVRTDRLLELVRLLTRGRSFANLRVPLAVVAVDLERGTEVILKEGPLPEAILASCSLPGVFVPQRLDGRLLVDGGLLNQVPANVVRGMGAEVVIAVDVGVEEPQTTVTNVIGVIMQTFEIMQREIARYKTASPADLVIRPDLGNISAFRFEAVPEIIEAGRRAAEAALPEIRRLLAAGKQGAAEGA
ncbi:MAG: patatin-like phospholipase family protein [Chitinophagales bacterium]